MLHPEIDPVCLIEQKFWVDHISLKNIQIPGQLKGSRKNLDDSNLSSKKLRKNVIIINGILRV